MLKTICDGCKKDLSHTLNHISIEGENVSGLLGAGLPDPGSTFHWCNSCALFAFKALEDKHAK